MHIASELVWLLGRAPLGRRSLARATGLGEIVVRQELEHLHERGLVEMDRQGTRLTSQGRLRFSTVLNRVKEVRELHPAKLALDRFTLGAQISGVAGSGSSWRLRDLAIREGASGAIFIACTASGLRFSDSDELLARRNPQDALLLQESFPQQEEGDLLALVSTPEKGRAHLGLWRIIVELLQQAAPKHPRTLAELD
jgi:predicted transcriptional regulator